MSEEIEIVEEDEKDKRGTRREERDTKSKEHNDNRRLKEERKYTGSIDDALPHEWDVVSAKYMGEE